MLLLALLVGCSERPCADDDCRTGAVQAATDPELAFALAGEIVDPARRDLVVMDLIRQTGWDRCALLADAALRDRCATTLQRPHLLEGRYAAVGATCAEATGVAADTCRLDAADGLLRSGELDGAAALCAAIQDDRWRDECRFRLSEHAPLDQRAGWCLQAGDFADHCFTHLTGALGEAAGADGVAGVIAGSEAALVAIARPDGPPRADPGVYWWSGLHVVAASAAASGSLAVYRAQASALPADQQHRAAILADVVATRQGVQRALSGGGTAPTPDALLAMASAEPWPGGAPPAVFEEATGSAHRARTAAALTSGSMVARFHLGRVPEVLDCRLEPDVQRAAAVAWALEVFDADAVSEGVLGGLRHDALPVRAVAVEGAVERGLNRLRHGASPAWLLDALDAFPADDPLAGRAHIAATALRTLSPPSPPPPPDCRPARR